ncbi:MAG: InlB B-repeat-containing protein, partial [Muribaculaceae bacterium]|nr:InlB B-repeat-containing protein [Muribaculaceae bacterium]
ASDCYLWNNEGVLSIASYSEGTTELPESAYFSCEVVDGQYMFKTVDGQYYMAFPSPGKNWLYNKSENGLEPTVSNLTKFDILKIVQTTRVQKATSDMFGQIYMWGCRGNGNSANGDLSYGSMIVKSGAWDGAGEPYCDSTPQSSAFSIVEVSYTPVYAVSAEASPANAGEVTISANEVEENGTVELTAVAATGYNFVNWTVNGEVVSTEASFESAAVVANTTFVANFAKKTYNATVDATEGGYVTTSEFTSPVEYGTEITIEATANEGYEFVMWLIDGEAGPDVNPWTFQVTTPLVMTAQFQAKNYTITYIVDGEEHTTETYAYGATVTPVAEPTKEGYTFSGWSAIPETMPAENVTVTGTFTEIIKEDVVVTDENKEENANAMYANVTVANEKVWDIKANTIKADKVSVSVSATGTAPQIKIEDGGEVTAALEVNRVVKKGEWAMMALPFAVDLANVTVNGAAAQDGVNIKVMVYDAAKRANESIELWTKSGWVDLQGTTIAANQGFAVAVNAQNGDEQTVTFAAATQTYDGSDKAVALDRHASTVNEGADADWNFFGNPTLANAEKGTGYALYIYNAEDDSYDEYASSDAVTCQPYAAMFVQSADDFNSLNFSAGTAGALADANGVYGEMQFSLNGEDEARVILSDEANDEYVRNEDALYFAAPNANLAQLYIVKGNIKMAVSEQPALSESMALGYKAAKAGEQTLTLTSLPDNASVVLKDNVTGDEVALTVGDSYTFESAAGTFNNRFVVKTTDLTGIAQATAEGDVKVVVNGDEINIYGAEAGAEVVAYTTNGMVVATAVATEGVTTLSTSANGVIIVKVANTAVKVVK